MGLLSQLLWEWRPDAARPEHRGRVIGIQCLRTASGWTAGSFVSSLYFVRSHLGAVTEGILCSWSVAPSRAFQTLPPQQVKIWRPSLAISRGPWAPFLLQFSLLSLLAFP